MDFLVSNKEWIFSGIGVFILGGIVSLFKIKNRKPKKYQNIKKQSGNNNIQTDGQVNINNTTNIYEGDELKKKEISPLILLANKLYKIFEEHGVSRGQIPSFIDEKFNIQYKDVEDEKSIIPKLNDELLDWVSEKFGINRSWFDASEEDFFNRKLYTSINCYKDIGRFINLFDELIDEFNVYNYKKSIRVKFLKNFKGFKGDESNSEANVIIIVMVEIGKTTTGTVYKYILISRNLIWNYWKSRQDIKRMIRIVERLGIHNDGFDISDKEFSEITSEEVVPRVILDKFRKVTWYPYDFDGSFNERINELEYEECEEFQESLKRIDMNISEMLEDKFQQLRDKKMVMNE